jgi:hypothetical protein
VGREATRARDATQRGRAADGGSLLTVSRQLRHAGIGITADTYTHAVPGSNRAAADVIKAILTGNHTQSLRNPS